MIDRFRHAAGLRGLTLGAALLFGVVIAGAAVAAADDSAEFSAANRLLFMSDQMANVGAPATLEYSYTRQGSENENYDDHVDLHVTQGSSDGKHVKIDFLSGDRHRYVPEVGNAHGNPVIMMFLQNDVSSIAERTGGSWRYFQRRVKFALQDASTVEDGTAEYDGKEVPVKRVRLQPFADEQRHRNDLAAEVDKRYTFTLSDDVPGGVLEMRSEIPPSADHDQKIVERLALRSVTHGSSSPKSDEPAS